MNNCFVLFVNLKTEIMSSVVDTFPVLVSDLEFMLSVTIEFLFRHRSLHPVGSDDWKYWDSRYNYFFDLREQLYGLHKSSTDSESEVPSE